MLHKMRKDEFEKVYDILRRSFPIDERRTIDEERQLLSNPIFDILVWKSGGNDEVKGFISIYRINGYCYVEHFAISEEYRGEGIGKSVLDELIKSEEKICLEVEPPNTEIAKRRIEFYRRNGFYLNEYPYIQPPNSKGTKAIPLLIMTTGGAIDEKEFLHIRKELYSKVYHI